jgi:hypothetical protein
MHRQSDTGSNIMTRSGITLFVAALLLQMLAARTAPLDKDGCAKLKAEQGQLEHAGTRGNMGKGPQWAKTNLEPEKLDQIRRLLEVDEQLLFRCHGKPLVNLPKDPVDPDPAAREPGTDGVKAGKAGKAPKVAKKEVVKKDGEKKDPGKKEAVKKAAAPPADPTTKGAAKQEPEAGTPEKKTAQKPPAAKKAKKQKADDAYRAPTGEPGSNPFANQAAPKQ